MPSGAAVIRYEGLGGARNVRPGQRGTNLGTKKGASRGALRVSGLLEGIGSSPGWTRTNNPPVNSRMLCQLSYRGRQRARSVAARNRGGTRQEAVKR